MNCRSSIVLMLMLLISCGRTDEAQQIVDRAIKAHGGELYDRMYLEFDFRGRHYTARRQKGKFIYTREFTDSTNSVKDILTNDGFTRLINGDTVDLPEERAEAYTNSVNSVIYFALLPQALNDPAVNKEFLGTTALRGNEYHKIRITFDQKGGGKDHEDVFIYWFDTKDFLIDYFSYLFYNDGGGIRFRETIDTIHANGIVLADYRNYALDDTTFDVNRIDSLFLLDQLEPVSEIRLENVNVEILQ